MPDTKTNSHVLLRAENLVKHYPILGGIFLKEVASVKAVDGVSITVDKGETLGLVGESGCGKTTLGRALLRLEEPTGGAVYFNNENILDYSPEQLRNLRKKMQIVFQDPFSSLNPRKTVRSIIGEPLLVHGMGNRKERDARVLELMEVVGLRREHMRRYPHQFSGGQRQRIGVARALALNPQLIVCDEAVSALDVSIQAQVINLFKDLQEEFDLTYLFISHDLSVVEHISDRVAVMYLGKIVESATSDKLYRKPLHPYTQALLSASPLPDPQASRNRIILKGDVPSPIDPPSGCRFHTRCLFAKEVCQNREPAYREVDKDHWVACFFAGSVGGFQVQSASI
ncbi:MAG: dipeptide ABC transporter ATP-binding protein [Thermodesulfobacteriota bacterium]